MEKSSSVAGPYCGNEHPPIFYSNGNSVNITFISDEFEDHNLVSSGFQIDFQCQNISITGKLLLKTCILFFKIGSPKVEVIKKFQYKKVLTIIPKFSQV